MKTETLFKCMMVSISLYALLVLSAIGTAVWASIKLVDKFVK